MPRGKLLPFVRTGDDPGYFFNGDGPVIIPVGVIQNSMQAV